MGYLGRRRSGIPVSNDSRDRRLRSSLAVLLGVKPLRRPGVVGCDRAQRILARLERLHDGLGIARACRQAGLQVHSDELDVGRSAERYWWLIGKCDLEKFADDGRGDIAAGLAMPHGRGVVETHIRANHKVGREADEPAILLVIGGPGLAGDGSLEHLELLRGTALDDAFHDGNHLISAHRIDDLRAIVDELGLVLTAPFPCVAIDAVAIVMLPDGAAVAILDAVD